MADKRLLEIPFSVLDLAPITEGNIAATSFKNSLALAQRAKQLGYNRYWLAEHHNMDSVAISATALLIGYIAGGDAQKVLSGMSKFQADAQLDEMMVTSHIYDHAARMHSYEVLKEVLQR